jgi:ABC-type uncharacterized transport system substrate-binding protein
MDRRGFVVALIFVCGCGPNEAPKKAADATQAVPAAAPPGSQRQSVSTGTRIPRVAMLVFGTTDSGSATTTTGALVATLFRNRLTELGYVEGKTIQIEERYADGDPQRLTQLAHEIVESKPDVIVAISAAATAAARQATSTIPIVMAHAGNPVGSGLVASLAHPGGNVTGTTSMAPARGAHQVELHRHRIPGLARLGVLANPTNAGAPPLLATVNEEARRFNISVVVAEVTRQGISTGHSGCSATPASMRSS